MPRLTAKFKGCLYIENAKKYGNVVFEPPLNKVSVIIAGRMYTTIYITFENRVLAEIPSKDAIKAHSLQFSLLYIYGASYEVSKEGKNIPKANAFFTFVTTYCKFYRIFDRI